MPFNPRDVIRTFAALPLASFNRAYPEVTVYNAVNPKATVVAILDGRILAVGSDQQILALAGKNTRRSDLARRRLLPGFNDAHAHP